VRLLRLRSTLAVAAAAFGCAPAPTLAPSFPTRTAPAPGNHWPLAPARAEELFAQAPLELRSIEPTEHGFSGPLKAEVVFPPDPREVAIQWKLVPPSELEAFNNSPRKEIAAYAIQKWFLEPQDYVVPTTALRCVPLASYRRIQADAEPTLAGTSCVLGAISLWLVHVKQADELLDPERFATDYAYAYHLSNLNVLTLLIRHIDSDPRNILVSDDETNRRVFSVDNSLTFDTRFFNVVVENWNRIRVPAIRSAVVEALRKIDPRQLDRLATLVELRSDAHGVLRPVPPSAPIDATQGVRIEPGRLQMGLTTLEIDRLAERLAELLALVDEGKLSVF
jgi:hypothetical protein